MELYPIRFFAPRVIEASPYTRMVQSVTLHKYGKKDRIKVEDTPLENYIPEDHVEVEVYYCGLSYMDHYMRLGMFRNENFPLIMGSECSGIITRVGNGVTCFQVGQRVLCMRMQGGLYRHRVHVCTQYCFAVPHNMSLKTAVGLGISFVLAYICLFELGCPERTKALFMDSIGGGVGTAVIKLARTIPGVTILGTASESKHEKLLSLGVDRVYRHEDDYVNKVLEACPRGVDLVINCAGGSLFDLQFKMLKPTGKLISIGSNNSALSTKTPTWRAFKPTWDNKLFTTAEMIKNNHTIAGVNIGKLLSVHPEVIGLVLNQVFEMYAEGKITPCIHSIQPFEKAADGLAQLWQRENVGKVLLSVNKKTDHWNEPIPVLGPAVTLPRYLGSPKGSVDEGVLQMDEQHDEAEEKERKDEDMGQKDVELSVNKKTDLWNEPVPVLVPLLKLPRYLRRPKRKVDEGAKKMDEQEHDRVEEKEGKDENEGQKDEDQKDEDQKDEDQKDEDQKDEDQKDEDQKDEDQKDEDQKDEGHKDEGHKDEGHKDEGHKAVE